MSEDWVIPAISAASGLGGTIIGGLISYFTQRSFAQAKWDQEVRAIAGAIGAEIDAYLDLMKRRNHVATAEQLSAGLRSGQVLQIRGFMRKDAKPLDQFPVFTSQVEKLGLLGDVCFNLARYYTLLAGVLTTVIDAEAGKYDQLSPAQKADLVDEEVRVWQEALNLGASLVIRLKHIARLN